MHWRQAFRIVALMKSSAINRCPQFLSTGGSRTGQYRGLMNRSVQRIPKLISTVSMNSYLKSTADWELTHIFDNCVFLLNIRFCGECGTMMYTEGDTWMCRSCGNE
ncbi:DNA-directed RNA polymerase subunit [Halorubrum sp. AJ67]|nr:DNA-directed RNA polymerase subunit [Halorubrum sp. AJ67]